MTRDRQDLMDELRPEMGPDEAQRLADRLAAHQAPELPRGATLALINRLRPLVPRPRPARFRQSGLTRQPALMLLVHLHGQARLFRPIWWLGSALMMAVSLLLAPVLAQEGLTLAAAAPPLVIAGMVYGFRSLRGSTLELELSCPITPGQVVLGRILILTLYCGTLGALAIFLSGGSGHLFFSWVTALIFFTGLMLTLTAYVGTATAVVGALLLWCFQLPLARYGYSLFAAPDLPLWLPMQVGALALGVALLLPGLSSNRLFHLIERGNG